ncbi:MAG: LysM peptidoglycan-binding domain-containing protein [Sphingobacteriales bacterium]|nr:LysM peptidoglycan-binding domain-containing protein [Sphingobacteriales bacterium]
MDKTQSRRNCRCYHPNNATHPKNTPTKVNINDLAELGSINLYDNNLIITDGATVVSEQLSRYGDLEADDADFVKTSQKFYTVRKGDALSEIATQNKCTVADLKRWNKLKSNVITPGQQLKIAPDATTLSDETTLEKAAAAAEEVVEDVVSPAAQQTVSGIGNYHQIDWDKLGISSDNKPTTTVEPITFDLRAEENIAETPTKPATKTITETVTETYTVKKGDVLGEIAEKFKCSVKDLQRWNSIKGTTIEHGDKLKIVRKVKKTIPADKDKPTTTSPSTKGNIPPPIVVDIDDIETLGGINLYDEGIVIGENIDNSSATALAARTNENTTDQPKATAKPATANPKLTSYKVKKGDTLWDIVQKFPANTVESLCQLNKLNKKSALQPGSTVKVKTK